MYKVWQINVNHVRRAQDLLAHTMMEKRVDIAVVAEPYNGRNEFPRWYKDETRTAAITWSESEEKYVKKIGRGTGWVTIKWREWTVISVYISPNISRDKFEEILEGVEREVRKGNREKFIIAGDFNAKSKLWGSRKECAKGRILCNWAAALGLRIMNRGKEEPCRKVKGMSIIDLTWGQGGAEKEISGWRVVGCETLSDHELIQFIVGKGNKRKDNTKEGPKNRWTMRKLNREELMDIIIGNTWEGKEEGGRKKEPV